MDSQSGAESQPEVDRTQPPPLRVDIIRTKANHFRIILSGELDLVTVGLLRHALTPLYQPDTMVTIELDGLTFLGLCGVQAIIDADLAATNAGAKLTVVVGPDHRIVTRILALTGLDQVLTLTSGETST